MTWKEKTKFSAVKSESLTGRMFLWFLGLSRHGCPFSLLHTSVSSASPGRIPTDHAPPGHQAPGPLRPLLNPNYWPSSACTLKSQARLGVKVSSSQEGLLDATAGPCARLRKGMVCPQVGLNPELWVSELGEATVSCLSSRRGLFERSTVSPSCPIPQHRGLPVPLSVEWMSLWPPPAPGPGDRLPWDRQR